METRAVYPLEIREEGRTLVGAFPYMRGDEVRALAVISDRGAVRKEGFAPRAFAYAVDDPEREIHLLSGHSFDKPLASRGAGTLALTDADDALTFRATLPEAELQPSWMVDTVKQIRAGLVGGISPGFRVPPADVVPDAETTRPERNGTARVRVIRAALLFELSLVARPAYPETEIDVRAWAGRQIEAPVSRPARRRRPWL